MRAEARAATPDDVSRSCSSSDDSAKQPGRRNHGEGAAEQRARKTATRAEDSAAGTGSKTCDGCGRLRDVLVRCRGGGVEDWRLLCTGKCWLEVSGGEVDGAEGVDDYVYGGMWKNRRAGVSARMPRSVKRKAKARRGVAVAGDGGSGAASVAESL